MNQFSDNLPGIIFLVVIVGICAFTAIRVGVRFLIRRLAGLVFVLWGVSFITFVLGYFAPGNAVLVNCNGHCSRPMMASLMHFYGLDQSFWQQYWNFLTGALRLDFGYSYIDRTVKVSDILSRYVPVSAQLGISGTVLAVVVGIPLGLYAAVKANSAFDTVAQTISLVLFALPSFVLIPFYWLLMINLHNAGLPSLAVTGWDTWDSWVAPIIIFGAGDFAFFVRITRASMMEVLRQDYVRTARAKGLTERIVVWRHAFRNALINVLTAVGPALGFAVGGVFIIELLFNIPGIGVYSLTAIENRDYPVVQATVLLIAVFIALANLITDVIYGIADPRIKAL
jgi:ABC-type dipeptide/oligopeptide/nickel transport system permease component